MNVPSRVSMAFKDANVNAQLNLGSTVITGLADNPSLFPKPPMEIADLKAVNEALNKDHKDVFDTGSRQARANIKASRRAWVAAFGLTAIYVDMQSAGEENIIVAGGYKPTKAMRTKKPIPGVATGFMAGTNGVKGSVLASIDKTVSDALAFIYYAAPEGAAVTFNDKTMVINMGGQEMYINVATKRMTEIYTQKKKASLNVGVFAVNAAGIGPSTPTQEVITQ